MEKKVQAKFKCELCQTKCWSLSGLNLHIKRVHAKIKDHFCKQCDAAFPDKNSLKSHAEAHSNVKNHGCELCPFKSSYLRSLERTCEKNTCQD